MYNLWHLISYDKHHHHHNNKNNTVSDRHRLKSKNKTKTKLLSGAEELELAAMPGDRRLAAA